MPTNNKKEGAPTFPEQASSAVAAPSPSTVAQLAAWQDVDALYGGTRTMRLAGKRFLPSQPKEQDSNYQRRLQRSTLHNFYKSSIQSAVGKVFAKEVILDKADPVVEVIAYDVDAQGRNLTQFAKAALEDAINHGITYLLVDHTRVAEPFPTLQDQQLSGARPYWVAVPAPKVLEARPGDFQGTSRLTYFRYLEDAWEQTPDGFSQRSFRQVRIFQQTGSQPVEFAVYREQSKGQWMLHDSGTLDAVNAIPVVPIYVNRLGFFSGAPPLQDLADVNFQHWQCSSDYQNSVHVATIPFLLTKGLQAQMDKDGQLKELTVDVNAGVTATDPNADVRWVEVSGAALEAARKNLDDLKAQMERLGMTLCAQTPGGITATEKSVNASEANSIIKAWALSLQDALNGALYFTAQYLGIPLTSQGTAQVNTTYAIDYAEPTTFAHVVKLHELNVIDAETVIAEAKRRDVLDPVADIKVPKPEPEAELEEDQNDEEEEKDEADAE